MRAGPDLVEVQSLQDHDSSPEQDLALENIVAVELWLTAVADTPGAAFAPHGQFRLCDTNPCPPEAELAFSDLSATSFPGGAEPGCKPGDVRDRPGDDGVLDAGIPISLSLIAVPEPGRHAMEAAVLIVLAALRRTKDRRELLHRPSV